MADTSAIVRKIRAHRGLPPPALRRALRESGGLTQDDVAEAVEVRRESVSRWESGHRTPRGRVLLAYAELLESLR